MEKKELYSQYKAILEEELLTAFGCTEPIAIAYAAAVAKGYLEGFPDHVEVDASGNIIKNVKSVVVPNSGGLRGIEASALLGIVCGDPAKKLQVIDHATDEDRQKVRQLLEQNFCTVRQCSTKASLKIILQLTKGTDTVTVTILHVHTNIAKIEKNGEILYEGKNTEENHTETLIDRSILNLNDILSFAEEVDLAEVEPVLATQINRNMAIAREGIEHSWGMQVGKTLYEISDGDVFSKCRAMAAAGSDARMSGCSMPVVINSGSGNQGLTASVPIIVYTQEHKIPHEKLLRALIISNLVAIKIKSSMSRLSAFCGAVSAACGSGVAITYLAGGNFQQMSDTAVNILGNVSGIVCDGAKPSCAAKIASSLDAAFLGHRLAMQGLAFHGGDGIIKDTINQTIQAVSRMETEGMKQTDTVILDIMTGVAK